MTQVVPLKGMLAFCALLALALILADTLHDEGRTDPSDPKLGKVYLNSDGTPKGSTEGDFFKVCEWRNLVYNNGGKIAVSQFDPQCDPAVRR